MPQNRRNKRFTEIDKINVSVIKNRKIWNEVPCNGLIVYMIHWLEELYIRKDVKNNGNVVLIFKLPINDIVRTKTSIRI